MPSTVNITKTNCVLCRQAWYNVLMMNQVTEKEMLKYEQTANVGDLIKAFDFKPVRVNGEMVADHPDEYIVGIVRDKGLLGAGYYDTANCRVGQKAFVPFQTTMEYANRVSRV